MNRRKILAFAVGPILGAALSIVALLMIGWYFSPEDVGRNNVFQIFTSFSILLLVLGLDQAYVREFHEVDDRFRLFKACFFPGTLFLIIFIISTLPFSGEISVLLYGENNPLWYWVTIFCVAFSFLSRYLSLVVRMQERGLAYSASQIIPKIAVLCILGSYILFGAARSYANLLYANLFSMFFVTLVFGWNTRKDWMRAIKSKIDPAEQKKLLKFGAPLIGAGIAYWGLSATSTIAIRVFSNFHELGVYSMAMSFAGLAVIFQSIFSTIWMPTVYKWVANKEDLNKIDAVTTNIAICICFIFCMVGVFSWVVRYILPDEYKNVQFLLVCCMAQPLLYTLSEATVVGLNVKRKSMHALGIALFALLCNGVFSAVLTPRLGATGAAISNALAYLVFFAARTEVSARLWRTSKRLPLYLMMCWMIFSSIGMALLGERSVMLSTLFWILNSLVLLSIFGKDLVLLWKSLKRPLV